MIVNWGKVTVLLEMIQHKKKLMLAEVKTSLFALKFLLSVIHKFC